MVEIFDIEWLEVLLSVLALIPAAISVYLLHRAAALPSLPDQSSVTLAWRERLYVQASSAGAVAVFFLGRVLINRPVVSAFGKPDIEPT